MIGLTGTSRLLKALGDETRLRILHLLAQEELSGTDLMEILNVGQSRISTHLALLKEVGLVNDRRVGRRTHHSIAPGPAAGLWESALAAGGPTPELEADLAGLEELRARRKDARRAYFDRVAATFGEELLPGRTWEGLARALLELAPRGRYVDLGIGDGLLTLMLAEIAVSVSAVDISPEMLAQLARRAAERGIDNIEWIEAEIEDLPMPDASHDCAVLSQALHHAVVPQRALEEARRVLVPGGRVLVIDLLAHGEEWVREKHQHAHLGFTEAALAELLDAAGFEAVRVQRAARDPQPPHFMTLVATGTRT
ncbi:MAG: metalloregulator ArsR/SmtB family transcription factor [Planctomycetota bacterium]|jgi:ArsR family transcriptional regulator|nr:metalloregulator ArsR/SmtB family transcription factor [Planctomycetota bacterium]MDP6761851.1 metalloregulator ArsR/SmtB family transcription factor [Planctomycetota bacterium]MDP6988897.1 metalloregulator ArsR/SmtB family transcription factor [Planctomycetota bacterium]